MNNLIKQLCESLFDDNETDNLLSNDDSVFDSILNRLDDIRKLFDKLSLDDLLKMQDLMKILFSFNTWDEMREASDKSPLTLYTIKVTLYSSKNNVNIMKKILDYLFLNEIKLDINYLEIILDNNKVNYTNIKKDIIDFSKYTNIKVKHLLISYGSLENLEGIPLNLYKDVDFYYVYNIKSFKGFPKDTDKFLNFNFTNSSLPDDWTYFPKTILTLELFILDDLRYTNKNKSLDQLTLEKEQVIHYYKLFKNLPDDFETYPNYPVNNPYYGCKLISNFWPVEFKKFCRDYISNCLKKNGSKNIKYLKPLLCNSLKFTNTGKKVD